MPNSEESAVDHGGTDGAAVLWGWNFQFRCCSTTFHAFVQFWWYCPIRITRHFWVDLLIVSCTVPCTSITWCIGEFGKTMENVSVFTADFAWNWCFIWQNTHGLRKMTLDLPGPSWIWSRPAEWFLSPSIAPGAMIWKKGWTKYNKISCVNSVGTFSSKS